MTFMSSNGAKKGNKALSGGGCGNPGYQIESSDKDQLQRGNEAGEEVHLGPPKKAWEFHYRSFLSRQKTAKSNASPHCISRSHEGRVEGDSEKVTKEHRRTASAFPNSSQAAPPRSSGTHALAAPTKVDSSSGNRDRASSQPYLTSQDIPRTPTRPHGDMSLDGLTLSPYRAESVGTTLTSIREMSTAKVKDSKSKTILSELVHESDDGRHHRDLHELDAARKNGTPIKRTYSPTIVRSEHKVVDKSYLKIPELPLSAGSVEDWRRHSSRSQLFAMSSSGSSFDEDSSVRGGRAYDGAAAFQHHKLSATSVLASLGRKNIQSTAATQGSPAHSSPPRHSRHLIMAATADRAVKGGSLFKGLFKSKSGSKLLEAVGNRKEANSNDSTDLDMDASVRRGRSREMFVDGGEHRLDSTTAATPSLTSLGRSTGEGDSGGATAALHQLQQKGIFSHSEDSERNEPKMRTSQYVNTHSPNVSDSTSSKSGVGDKGEDKPSGPNSGEHDKIRKIVFTNYHSSNAFGKDSTSAYLGDESSLRAGDAFPGPSRVSAEQDQLKTWREDPPGDSVASSCRSSASSFTNESFRENSKKSSPIGDLDASVHPAMATVDSNAASLGKVGARSVPHSPALLSVLNPIVTPNSVVAGTTSVRGGEMREVPGLIGPALLSMCPVSLFAGCGITAQKFRGLGVSSNEGAAIKSGFDEMVSFKGSSLNETTERYSTDEGEERVRRTLAKKRSRTRDLPMGMHILGRAKVCYHDASAPGWKAVHTRGGNFVLYNNYLLEFSGSDAEMADGCHAHLPIGYAHLQHAIVSRGDGDGAKGETESWSSLFDPIKCFSERVKDEDTECLLQIEFDDSDTTNDGEEKLTVAAASSTRCDQEPQTERRWCDSPVEKAGKLQAQMRKKVVLLCGSPADRNRWCSLLTKASTLTVESLYELNNTTRSNTGSGGELGRGRYSTIHSARPRYSVDGVFDLGTSSSYNRALKVISKDHFRYRVRRKKERADTLLREAAVQCTLTCYHASNGKDAGTFVQIFGFFETRTHLVMELELLGSEDLFSFISSRHHQARGDHGNGGRLNEAEAALITLNILQALALLKRLGIAHRDVKPANLLMCDNKEGDGKNTNRVRVKLGDYGMAAFVGADGLVRGRCGTPGYVAPEILSAGVQGGYENKVDIFSAGVTLYVMLCGYEPFYGENDKQLVAANKLAKFDFPRGDWSTVSEGAKDLIRRMMERDPTKRIKVENGLEHPWIMTHCGRSGVDSEPGGGLETQHDFEEAGCVLT